MLLAYVDGDIADAAPGGRGECPGCGDEVIAKCGEILVWHWAHRADAECDSYSEGESAWHAGWKNEARRLGCSIEVTYREGKDWHRADVVRPDGINVELQHSAIDLSEFDSRVRFYRRNGGIAWVFDASDRWGDVLDIDGEGIWPRAPKFLLALNRSPLFLDFGAGTIRRVEPIRDDPDSSSWLVTVSEASVLDVLSAPMAAPVTPLFAASSAMAMTMAPLRAEWISLEEFVAKSTGRHLLRWTFDVWPEDGGGCFTVTGVTPVDGRRCSRWSKATEDSDWCRVRLRNSPRWGLQVEDVVRGERDMVALAIEAFGSDVAGLGPRRLGLAA